ncbi:hypothetical protein GPALN_010724 [Globodera pallida]|nr:hypothetical protein GPALN_010724 [Globodera pallida]
MPVQKLCIILFIFLILCDGFYCETPKIVRNKGNGNQTKPRGHGKARRMNGVGQNRQNTLPVIDNSSNNKNNKQYIIMVPTLPPVKIPVPIIGFVTLAPKNFNKKTIVSNSTRG